MCLMTFLSSVGLFLPIQYSVFRELSQITCWSIARVHPVPTSQQSCFAMLGIITSENVCRPNNSQHVHFFVESRKNSTSLWPSRASNHPSEMETL